MWKKDEVQPERPTAEAPRPTAPKRAPTTRETATIGPSITIRGDVTGSEDLLIQGRVDGSITLGAHAVSVGSEGKVRADITGRVITVEGEVEGDLTAKEQIALLGTARVQGDIKAPRVVLEDGASFRGLVDMGTTPSGGEPAKAGSAASGAAEEEARSGEERGAPAGTSETPTPQRSRRPTGVGAEPPKRSGAKPATDKAAR